MIELINANTLAIPLAEKSVQMIAFSPPYWGLRSYQTGDNKHAELGAEPLHDCLGWATGSNCGACFVCNLRNVAAECWRVLRDDGVMFINLGDSYAAESGPQIDGTKQRKGSQTEAWGGVSRKPAPGLKPKDLCGIPWRVALALQSDGWYLRSDIIWAKPNPMPESVTDRPTKAHEYVFLLSKSQKYFWDQEGVKEARENPGRARGDAIGHTQRGLSGRPVDRIFGSSPNRNIRTVWNVATYSYSGNHFATWPPALVEKMIRAGTSEKGACPKCGKQWERVVEKGYTAPAQEEIISAMIAKGIPRHKANLYGNPTRAPELYAINPNKTNGWQPACTCYGHFEKRKVQDSFAARATGTHDEVEVYVPHDDQPDPTPAIVLDPFAGSGTTLMVARKLGRSAIGLDLSYTYLHDNARERLMLDALEGWENGRQVETTLSDLPMFGGMP